MDGMGAEGIGFSHPIQGTVRMSRVCFWMAATFLFLLLAIISVAVELFFGHTWRAFLLALVFLGLFQLSCAEFTKALKDYKP
jgi:hypothetical protein